MLGRKPTRQELSDIQTNFKSWKKRNAPITGCFGLFGSSAEVKKMRILGEGPAQKEGNALLQQINTACGTHLGDTATVGNVEDLIKEAKQRLGEYFEMFPTRHYFSDRKGFGR